MIDKRIMSELSALSKRIYTLESKLKTLDYAQHEESASKIDYVAMMTDVEIETEEESREDLDI